MVEVKTVKPLIYEKLHKKVIKSDEYEYLTMPYIDMAKMAVFAVLAKQDNNI